MSVASFSKAAQTYNRHAHVQHAAADRLALMLQTHIPAQSISSLIEYGAGTGILSRKLMGLFPQAQKTITDASDSMVESLRQAKFDRQTKVEKLHAMQTPPKKVDLVASNMMLQWLDDLKTVFNVWRRFLNREGIIAITFPERRSFPEWKRACRNVGVVFTGRTLPELSNVVEELEACDFRILAEDRFQFVQHREDVLSFFKDIKGVGANYSDQSIDIKSFRAMISKWNRINGLASNTYHIHLIVAQYET